MAAIYDHRPDVEMLAAVIAHSQIVVEQAYCGDRQFPAGFDDADIAVLDWIAAEGRRAGASFVRM